MVGKAPVFSVNLFPSWMTLARLSNNATIGVAAKAFEVKVDQGGP
jgi:hypothetical protein